MPALRLVVSGLVQTVWAEMNQREANSAYAVGFVDRQGRLTLIAPGEQAAEGYADLRRTIDPRESIAERLPALWLLNLRVSKEFGPGYGLACYANNLPANRPRYVSPRTGAYRRRNEALFFGAEVYVRL